MITKKIIWPIDKQATSDVFNDLGIELYKEMFGSLSDESSSPYSRISVANSSFSLDPVKWCPLWCAYCVVWSNTRDLNIPDNQNIEDLTKKDYKKMFPKVIKVLFWGKSLMEHLTKHPAFIMNKSVISVWTWSSEAFLWDWWEETASIIDYMIENKLTNPIWIVTKAWIPKLKRAFWKDKFIEAKNAWIQIILSVTYSGAPSFVEPHIADRFEWIEEFTDIGIHISHHLRPIIRGLSDDYETAKKVLSRSAWLVDSVCVWWLRLDPWLILAWKHASWLDLDLLPSKPWEKDLPDDYEEMVRSILNELSSDVPIFDKSSLVISYACWKRDYNLYHLRNTWDFKNKKFLLHVPSKVTSDLWIDMLSLLRITADEIGLWAIRFYTESDNYYVSDDMSYHTHRTLIHALWHKQIF